MSLAKIKCRDGQMRTKTELDELKKELVQLQDLYSELQEEKYTLMK